MFAPLLFFEGDFMGEQISFKTRVKNIAIQYAKEYYSYYVCKSYIIISDAFERRSFYEIEAEKSNYLHLVGVSTGLSAEEFFDKCLNGTLDDMDFELVFHGKDPKFSKGSIRQKIITLPDMMNIFSAASLVEEDFHKNVVRCSIATTNGLCTVGFVTTPQARPMTLLKGDELDHSKTSNLKIVLSKSRDESLYSNVVVGSDADIATYYDDIKDILDETLIRRIDKIISENN